MIGILASAEQTAVIEEFFELFKTPWELYEPGRRFDVLVTTTGEIPDSCASLIVAFGSEPTAADARYGIAAGTRGRGASLECGGARVPIYGECLTFEGGRGGTVCLDSTCGILGLRFLSGHTTVLRIGYDVFEEARVLLSTGQPVQYAHVPALDMHIGLLRDWILGAGLPLLEIPPVPAGRPFWACLTHDIDFVAIRQHRFDHSMWGFLYRSTVGGIRGVLKRKIPLGRLAAMWRAAMSLPFVYAGWLDDFWEPFGWYARVEHGLPATYFLIPFKRRPGERVPGAAASRRGTAYDIADVREATAALIESGCEVGVHGIDAWHSAEKGREELARIAHATGRAGVGVRIHWLLRDEHTFRILDEAGYAYDSTAGYNETVGYRNGTTQVFRPIGARSLLELPLHIQDGALFYPQRLDLSEAEAAGRCDAMLANAARCGGVVTVLWHDRSHGPERFWGSFYIRLLGTLRTLNAWFGTGAEVITWFRQRRAIRFERVERPGGACTRLRYDGNAIRPPVTIRVHRPSCGESSPPFVDRPWSGETGVMHDPRDHSEAPSHRGVALTCAAQ